MRKGNTPGRFKTRNIESNFIVREGMERQLAEGLGFNWFASFRKETYPAPDDEKRWKRIFDRLEWLNPKLFRFGLGKEICDDAGRLVTDVPSLKQLVRLDRWAQKRGARIILSPFWVPTAYQYDPWPGAPGAWDVPNDFHFGVKDIDRYVSKFVVPLVKHAVVDLDCRSVVYFNHVNEPLMGNICATPPPLDDHKRYVEVCAGIRQGLREAGLSHVGNLGPDTATLRYWPIPRMLEHGADLNEAVDAYSMHHYASRFDWDVESHNIESNTMTETMETMVRPFAKYAHEHRKPFLMTEMGMFHYGWSRGDSAGIQRHDTTVLEAEFIVRALGAGADCVLRWAWLNPGDMDGWWQLLRTTDGSDEPMENSYRSYGTLCRFIGERAKILPVGVMHYPGTPVTAHALAVENLDGTRTIFVVNDAYADVARVNVQMRTGGPTTVRKIVNDPVRKYHYAGDIDCPNGQLDYSDLLSPMSLTVYTTSERL